LSLKTTLPCEFGGEGTKIGREGQMKRQMLRLISHMPNRISFLFDETGQIFIYLDNRPAIATFDGPIRPVFWLPAAGHCREPHKRYGISLPGIFIKTLYT
jgi:hypothetical protein